MTDDISSRSLKVCSLLVTGYHIEQSGGQWLLTVLSSLIVCVNFL